MCKDKYCKEVFRELDKLEAENEELKEAYCNGLDEYKICRSLQNAEYRIYELETALDEIEHILEVNKRELDECLHNDIGGQILLKIKEVRNG